MASKESRERRNSVSATNTTNDPVIRSMETLLRRAQVLNGAVDALLRDLNTANPLLPYPAMQTRLNHIQSELNECKTVMDENMDVFANVVLVPTLKFPTRYQSHVIEHLFRTKLEPNVEEWQRQTLKIAAEKDNKQDRERREGRLTSLPDEERHEFWQEAAIIADSEVRKHAWFSGDYTLAEVQNGVENVRHGLKRELKLPDTEPGDDEDDEEYEFEDADESAMDVDQTSSDQNATSNTADASQRSLAQAMPLDSVLRLMTKGQ